MKPGQYVVILILCAIAILIWKVLVDTVPGLLVAGILIGVAYLVLNAILRVTGEKAEKEMEKEERLKKREEEQQDREEWLKEREEELEVRKEWHRRHFRE